MQGTTIESLEDISEPYVRGPHLKYFAAAMTIAFSITATLAGGVFLLLTLIAG